MAARERVPGISYDNSLEGKPPGSFLIMYKIPQGSENDEITELSDRFETEHEAVGDVFEKYGLPRLSYPTWSNKVVDADGEYFYSEFQLDADGDELPTDFGMDPEPGELDRVVINRLAGDDTPSIEGENGSVDLMGIDNITSFGGASSTENNETADVIADVAGDKGNRMESVREAIGEYNEQQASERDMDRRERDMSRGLVNETGGMGMGPS